MPASSDGKRSPGGDPENPDQTSASSERQDSGGLLQSNTASSNDRNRCKAVCRRLCKEYRFKDSSASAIEGGRLLQKPRHCWLSGL